MSTIETKILRLHPTGLSNRAIASQVGCHHNTVSYHLRKHNLRSNWDKRQPIDMVDEEHARCSRCKEIKPILEFQHGRRGQQYEYRFSYCNKCRKKQVYLNLNNDCVRFLRDRYNRLKRKAKSKDIVFTLTAEELIAKYHQQQTLCFYTDVVMDIQVGNGLCRHSMSVDRLNPKLGYTNANTALCTHKANTIKSDLTIEEVQNWLPTWFERIQQHDKDQIQST